MDEKEKPLVFIDREGKPGGGEGSADFKGLDIHPERFEAELVVVGEL